MNASDPANKHEPNVAHRLSVESQRFDVGGKGYLSKSEQGLRDYDTNDDGDLDINEMKAIVRDLKDSNRDNSLLKKMATGTVITLLVSLIGNFGLVWSVMSLTRQLETKDGGLVDAHTGKMVATQARGVTVKAHLNPESNIEGRRLEDVPATALIGCDASCARNDYNGYINGGTITWTFQNNGVDNIGQAQPGAITHKVVDGCDIYENIISTATGNIYTLECCGADDCQSYWQTPPSNGRNLGVLFDDDVGLNCFSKLTTVIERSKGKMYLKDLKFGDHVLASGGVYSPVIPIHSNHFKPTDFVQIQTDYSEDAPLELSADHFVFVHDKDLPIVASEVKVGDKFVGTDGLRTVTKIGSVTRDGFYNVLTLDATIVANGNLASIATDKDGKDYIYIGPMKMHIHKFAGQIAGPLNHAICKMNTFFCTKQVADGQGGHFSVMNKVYAVITSKIPVLQGVLALFIVGMLSITVLSYNLTMALVPSTLLFGCMVLVKKQKKDKVL